MSSVVRECLEIVAETKRLDIGAVPGSVPDAGAAIAWSIIAEPGDGVAGALRAQLGAPRAWQLVVEATSAQQLVDAVVRTGENLGEVSREQIRAAWARWSPRCGTERFRQVVASADSFAMSLLTPGSDNWPRGLDDLGAHAPAMLWVRGNPDTLHHAGKAAVAIVGARAATAYGEHCASELAGGAGETGMLVASGGAYGIDGMAHRAALGTDGTTVAILAGGLDRLYPSGHEQLLRRVIDTGAVVAETPPATAPTKWRFLQRNRVLAAMTAATVVVEAGNRSGSLNTAHHALALGRPLGAVPGPITSAASLGCHMLLRESDAQCITSVADLRELIGQDIDSDEPDIGTDRSAEEVRARDALSTRVERDLETIVQLSGLDVATAMSMLARLEFDDAVVRGTTGWRLRRSALRAVSR